MLRRALSTLALVTLAGAGALVPTVASAAITGTIVVTSDVVMTSSSAGTAQVEYRCYDPEKVITEEPLQVSITQYANGAGADATGAAADPGNLEATCDDTTHALTVPLSVYSGSIANGPAEAGLYIGYGGPGDLGPLRQDVTVSGLPEVDPRAAVAITLNATPEPATKGKKITVKGTIERDGKAYKGKVVTLELKEDGGAYERVKDAKADSKGKIKTTVTATTSGSFRFTSAATAKTRAGRSNADHVTVKAPSKANPKPKTYKNCTALRKVYPHGVGKPGAKDKGGDVTTFTRDAKTYAKNKKSDRDKDGIACELA